MLYTTNGLMTKDNKPLVCVHSYDGAQGSKGQKLVNFSCRFLPSTDGQPHALRHVRHFMLYSGSDDNASLHHYLAGVLPEINDFITTGRVVLDDDTVVPLDHLLVADVVGLQHNYGMAGGLADCVCPFCTVSREDHFSQDCAAPERTVEMTELLSHTKAGLCPGCGFTIMTQEEYVQAKKQNQKGICPVAAQGDTVPTWLEKEIKKKFPQVSVLQVHSGVRYGSNIVLKVPFKQTAACIMHLNCCIVGLLCEGSIFAPLNAYHTKKSEKGESLCERLCSFMNDCGITISKLTPADNSVGTWYNTLTKHRFAGRHSSLMLEIYEDVLGFVFTDELCAADIDARDKRAQWLATWKHYKEECWGVLCKRATTTAEILAKADAVETAGKIFLRMVVAAYKKTGHLYPHILAHHVPQQLRRLEIDLWELMMQAIEHLNKWVKSRQLQTTNKHKIKDQESEVRSHNRDGRAISGYKRKSGSTGVHQVLSLSLMKDKLSDVSLDLNMNITDTEAARIRHCQKAVQQFTLHKKLC